MSDQQPPSFGETGGSSPSPSDGSRPPQYSQAPPAYSAAPPAYPQVPPGYVPAGQGYGSPMQSLGKATTSMVLGIVGLATLPLCGVLLTIFLAPTAFFIGRSASKEIDANPGRYSNGGQAKAGWIMGLIGMVLTLIGIAAIIALFAVGAFESDF